MGSSNTKPVEPPKTAKEMAKDMKRGIDKMIRDFKREITRLDMDSKKIKKDIENMIKKKEPKSSQKILAQQYLKK